MLINVVTGRLADIKHVPMGGTVLAADYECVKEIECRVQKVPLGALGGGIGENSLPCNT